MTENDSLARQAAAWVPPWVRDGADPDEPRPPTSEAGDLHSQVTAAWTARSEAAYRADFDDGSEADAPATRDFTATPPEPEPEPEGLSRPVTSQAAKRGQIPARAEPEPEPEPEPAGIAAADLIPALEAIMLVVDEPVSEIMLAQVLDLPAEEIAGALIELSASYAGENRGFDLRRAAGGWRLYTRAEYAPYVERFVLDGQQLRLTQASLETLAVIAYKQPVTRSRISAIRGVNCDGVIRTLVTRGMIEECGTEPDNGAFLYRTTTLFLEKLGLDSVDQLPSLAPFLPENFEEIADEQR